MKKQFEQLTALSSTGKQKEWSIRVSEKPDGSATITTIHGYVDGKKQINEKHISKGKNIGKVNETTPFTQAVSDANSKWNKKFDSGYRPVNTTQKDRDTILLPMLALDYTKRGHNIEFPCFVQPKIDGVRCIFSEGKIYSRKGKEFPHLKHIVKECSTVDCVLDGELYSDTLPFQELVGIVRRITLTDEDKLRMCQVKFIVFDCIVPKPFSERYTILERLFTQTVFQYSELLDTRVCTMRESVPHLLVEYETKGFEGLILRNRDGEYKQSHRSKDLQKLKSFVDDEFLIIGFCEGEGLEQGCVIWECATKTGQSFHCRPIGTRESRIDLFRRGNTFIGKRLTVKFQELTSDGLPRFPVGLAVRDYE